MPDDWDFSIKPRTEQPMPIITYGLCALCVLLTCARWYALSSQDTGPMWARISAFVAPSAAQIWDGAYYGLVTTFFAHVDIMHLIFNMLYFVRLGRAMEAEMPPWAYFLFLVSSAAVSMGCELGVMGHAGIGASGVVYAMFGLMWVGRAKYHSWSEHATRQNLNIFLIWGVYCIFSTVAGFMRVANAAHFSGLLFGLAIGWLFLAPRRQVVWAIPLALIVLLAGVSPFWIPWSAAWNNYRADKAFDARQYSAAIDWYHRSLRLGGDRYTNWENIKRAWMHIEAAADDNRDAMAVNEAQRQIESAERLEGPNPELTPEPQSTPGFRESKSIRR